MENLRRTTTTHSSEFSGLFWGISVPLFPVLIVTLVFAVGLTFVAADRWEWSLGSACMPGLAMVAVVFWLLRSYGQKPKGTITDQIEFLFTRGNASPFTKSRR